MKSCGGGCTRDKDDLSNKNKKYKPMTKKVLKSDYSSK